MPRTSSPGASARPGPRPFPDTDRPARASASPSRSQRSRFDRDHWEHQSVDTLDFDQFNEDGYPIARYVPVAEGTVRNYFYFKPKQSKSRTRRGGAA